MAMIKKQIYVTERNVEVLDELQDRFGMSHSESLRRLIDAAVQEDGTVVLPRIEVQRSGRKIQKPKHKN